MKPLNEPLKVLSRAVLQTVSGLSVAVGCTHCLDGDPQRRDAQDEANCNRLRDTWNACHGLDLPDDLPPGILAEAITTLRGLNKIMDEVMKQSGKLVFQDYGLLSESLMGATKVLEIFNKEPS